MKSLKKFVGIFVSALFVFQIAFSASAFASSFDDIRYLLMVDNCDWDKIDALIIVGCKKPLRYYFSDAEFIGSENSPVIVFHPQSPFIQYSVINEIYCDNVHDFKDLIRNHERSEPALIVLTDKKYDRLHNSHSQYIKEETPDISNQTLVKFFPETFFKLTNSKNIPLYSIYLAEQVERLPVPKRNNIDLLESYQSSSWKIYKDGIEIFKKDKKFSFAYVYKNGKLIYDGKRYIIISNHDDEIIVDDLMDEIFTYKIAKYNVADPTESVRSVNLFENNLVIKYYKAEVSEDTIGYRIVSNFVNSEENRIDNPIKHEKQQLDIVEIDFSHTDFSACSKPKDDIPNYYNILHTIGHLILEVLRTKIEFNIEEIALNIVVNKSNENEAVGDQQTSEYKLLLLDLTGRNNQFREYLSQTHNYSSIFKVAWKILYDCPCNLGCFSCLKIHYCNIQQCETKLEKMGTYRLLTSLYSCFSPEEENKDVNLYVRWKLITDTIEPEETGITRNDEQKKNEMENLVLKLIDSRHKLNFANTASESYPSTFFTIQEITSKQKQFGKNAILYGLTYPGKQISYLPGLPEFLLFETMFHERFHNYQFNQGKLEKNLMKFDWKNIDDPENIPYIGNLLLEGSAVWFSLRAMEFFCELNFSQNIVQSKINEYIAGVKVMLEIERDYGFTNAIMMLFNGKLDIHLSQYMNQYQAEINMQVNSYLSITPIYPRLQCMEKNNDMTNYNRLSYALQAINNSSTIFHHVSKLASALPECKNDIINLALRLAHSGVEEIIPDQTADENAIRLRHNQLFESLYDRKDIFLENNDRYIGSNRTISELILEQFQKMKLVNSRGLMHCCECETNCRLFNLCMINGGEDFFKKICNYHFNRVIFNVKDDNIELSVKPKKKR